MRLSPLVPVLQRFPHRALDSIPAAVEQQLEDGALTAGLRPGARIAIGAGSRGIANLSEVVRSAVSCFLRLGFKPFVVPAMGSHGGGTAEGQADILARYGITEASIGCPVVSSIEVVPLGRSADGIETFIDKQAFESDGIVVVNRIKWHTTFEDNIESGLLKMIAIGLGKVEGASTYHQNIVRKGFGPVIRSVGRHVLASGKILGGLAILEDAHHDTARIAAIRAEDIEREEERLLALAKSWKARILFDEVDVLIVDEMGKHISGVGMDSKVVNRHPYGGANVWPDTPRIYRIFVRDLQDGNAVGIGMADMVTERLVKRIDWKMTKVNALTASNLHSIRTPLQCATDREGIETLARTVGLRDSLDVKFVWIKNTLELADLLVSENLLDAPRSDI
ncbi:MAG: hypothetical protein ACRD7E_20305, partial [Bryobacteraceae bacterium]